MSGWGKLLNSFHDEGHTFHLLRDDNSPACGCSYYTTTGEYPGEIPEHQKCANCKRVEATSIKKAVRQARVAAKKIVSSLKGVSRWPTG